MTIAADAKGLREQAQLLAPGVFMAFTIAAAATFLTEHYGAPVMLFALLIGMAFHFLSQDGPCVDGIEFTASRLLKIGVALLGVRVSFSELASLGPGPALLTPVLIGSTIGAGVLISRVFGRRLRFGLLTGGAVAICGASAALALASVLPKKEGGERDTLFAVIAVTTLSTIAMIAYPIIFTALGFNDQQIGYLIGATIHDVAQVIGAGYAVSENAGAVATYVKMMRVAMLPVVIIVLALAFRSDASAGRSSFPWFAVGFAALLALNSTGVIPPVVVGVLTGASQWLLVAAIAALGMKTSLKAMADLGAGHIGVVVAQSLFLFGLALAAVNLI